MASAEVVNLINQPSAGSSSFPVLLALCISATAWNNFQVDKLSDFRFTFHFHALEKEMASHSSVLAWRILGTGEPVGCRLWSRTESDTTEAT